MVDYFICLALGGFGLALLFGLLWLGDVVVEYFERRNDRNKYTGRIF